ncbi:aminopeptidase N [Massilia aquatica]|uniref:Aminopeptidase N n=1 Tax=Massilia aquatica TaxID=2609000 RepID=A0ABX0MHG4_9BURK|nr:aminopeptidase N [Massilia aquatica]NHZ44343.1 aminopeptidase N [Massilia aquatica]
MSISRFSALGALLLAGAACTAAPAPAPVRADALTQADAAARSKRIANVAYVLDFTLSGAETFSGASTLQFDLADTRAPITVDLDKATIASLTVNGVAVTPQYNKAYITIAARDLKVGRNSITVNYQRAHSTNGEGLHRMRDPVDGKVYTYSHFEPAAAQQMFALFDQPDLKATYQLTVTAPADWQVVSTRRESAIEERGATRRWTFPATRQLSAYNFSMHAGPYKVWEDNSGKYPMRLLARQSVAAQVSPADWFKYTSQGLAYFDNYFGIPYQFDKYDQVLVPDFLYGAMENAGAVTFAENGFLYKAAMTEAQRETLAEVILHEMAHQWFGDLVTMKWWNGLWLNESFASFMATMATAESTEFTGAWQTFYAEGKQQAYVQDQSPATHPIEVPVASTANAFDNIDAITYSKGASTLKQLRHLLGEEVFRKGVHNYLVKYQYKNAQLDDFIGSLGDAAGRDLKPWTQQWLYKAGVNTLAAEYRCSAGKIASFSLRQSAPAALPTLREQRVQVATFVLDAGKLAAGKTVAVTYKGATTGVPELVGSACPDLVYPNYQDWGYVKVKLDKRSFASAGAHLGAIDEPLLRAMMWQSLWDGVRDGELPLDSFIQTALANAPQEKNYNLLGDVLAKVAGAKYYIDVMHAPPRYTQKTIAALEAMMWRGVEASKGNANFTHRWMDAYLDAATTVQAQERLVSILDGATVLEAVPVDQDLRWKIIEALSRAGYSGSVALIAAEQARDNSDAGQAAALRATVIRPDAAVKRQWLATIMDQKTTLPFSRVRTAMENLYPAGQRVLSEMSAAERLRQLPALDKAAGPVYMRSFAATLIPKDCTPASVARLARAAKELKGLSEGTMRALRDQHENDRRCLAVRKAMKFPQE